MRRRRGARCAQVGEEGERDIDIGGECVRTVERRGAFIALDTVAESQPICSQIKFVGKRYIPIFFLGSNIVGVTVCWAA